MPNARDDLRALALIARTDLRRLAGGREAILWAFVMPVVFMYLGTLTAGDGFDPTARRPLALVASPASGYLGDVLARRLDREGFDVARPTPDADLTRFPRRLYLVPGFTDSVLAGQPVAARLVVEEGGATSAFDEVCCRKAVFSVLADLVLLGDSDGGVTPAGFTGLESAPRGLTLEVVPAGARRRVPTGAERSVPATVIMFTMLVVLANGAVLLVIERDDGVLRRLASTPISRQTVVAGKIAGKLAFGVVQIAVGLLAGTLLFSLDWTGGVGGVALVMTAWAGLNASLAVVLGQVARSQAQARVVGIVGTLAMAALGGCWWPIEAAPAWLQSLSRVVPARWALDAFHRVSSFGEPWLAVLPQVGALVLVASVLAIVAARLFRFR